MMALFILVSSISYFFTWKADQDKIFSYSWHILFNSKVNIANSLGKLGALSSHFLFYYGFGIAALLIVPIIIHLGFRFLHRSGWLSFLRFTTHTLVIMSLLSMIFYYVFQNWSFPMEELLAHEIVCGWKESWDLLEQAWVWFWINCTCCMVLQPKFAELSSRCGWPHRSFVDVEC